MTSHTSHTTGQGCGRALCVTLTLTTMTRNSYHTSHHTSHITDRPRMRLRSRVRSVSPAPGATAPSTSHSSCLRTCGGGWWMRARCAFVGCVISFSFLNVTFPRRSLHGIHPHSMSGEGGRGCWFCAHALHGTAVLVACPHTSI